MALAVYDVQVLHDSPSVPGTGRLLLESSFSFHLAIAMRKYGLDVVWPNPYVSANTRNSSEENRVPLSVTTSSGIPMLANVLQCPSCLCTCHVCEVCELSVS